MSRDQGLGAFIANPLGFVARQLPSANENRGNLRLDDAHRIAIEYESVIDPKDREAIESTITQSRLFSSWNHLIVSDVRQCEGDEDGTGFEAGHREVPTSEGVSQSCHACAKICQWDTLGAPPPYLAAADPMFQSVANVTKSLYRCYLSCKEVFPTPMQKREWAAVVWCEASVRTGTYPGPLFELDWFTIDGMKLLSDMKENIRHTVETSYRFDATESIGYNATRAKELLSEMAFIHGVRLSPSRRHLNGGTRHPYRHPLIQKAIITLWFKNKSDDGMTFREHFSPLPIPAMALVLVVIQCCIDEWAEGTRKESSWDETRFKSEYLSHIKALAEFQESDGGGSGDPLEVIRSDLLENASDHVGMTDTQDDTATEAFQQVDLPIYNGIPIPKLSVIEDEG
ncbi:hypothetical protein F5148DRAFT_1154795 [Russula earlei]|uniref:Uncharacterized protein n=1 Tax=Russula earlei TaxID=71964 RepID=A0ACC0TRV2_9AGAM|nr:hypothetical protein F5148DRAFT_1154795 [Russula earlei]